MENRYINILGEDKLNVINCFEREKEKLSRLTDKELQVLGKCLEFYENNIAKDGWRDVLSRLLNTIPESKELISDIKDINSIDYQKMVSVLFNQDFVNPRNETEYENYESLKKQECDKLIKSPNLEDKKTAILESAYGHNLAFAQRIVQRYGEDIEKFPNSQIKDYISSLKSILEEKNGAEIQKSYKQLSNQNTYLDIVSIERQIKNGFFSLYNENLFNVQQGEKVEGEDNIYNAGVDFNMIVHSVSALSIEKDEKWRKDAWMRPNQESRNICASYIRHDMMATAPISSICFGFNNIEAEHLNMMSNTDMGSPTAGSIAANYSSRSKFFTPNSLINNTINRVGCLYNEIDINRIQNEKKKEPDYIVVFKRDGKIRNMDIAKEAQKDWISEERPNGLPIVVVDQDLCLYNEIKKLIDLAAKFKQEPSQEVAQEIYYKIKNNRHHEFNFAESIDLSENIEFVQIAQQVVDNQFDIEQELHLKLEKCREALPLLQNKSDEQKIQQNKPKEIKKDLQINNPLTMNSKDNKSNLWQNRFKGWYQESKKYKSLVSGVMESLKRKVNKKEIDKNDDLEK